MINNKNRIGNFTSSEIAQLMGTPKAFNTYVQETNMERRLARSLTDEVDARPLTWGKLIEKRAFELLGMEYALSSTETDVHPNIPYWAGSKDGIKLDKGKTVIDIKCPITLKSFCQLVDPLYEGKDGVETIQIIRNTHKSGEKYYWQLVSNAVINQTDFAELIVYVPYFSELQAIREMAHNVPAEVLSKHYWIAMSNDGDLPFLVDGGYYKNLNVIRFEVSVADKLALATAVQKAGKLLINNADGFIATHDKEVSATLIEGIKLQKL